jgi:hypothetical protein
VPEPKIETLVGDIEQVLKNSLSGRGEALSVEQQADLGARLSEKVAIALNRQGKPRPPNTLYMSEIGKPCLRQLWYTIHRPSEAIPIRPNTQVKFLYGDLIEELALFLAKQAGHKVEGEQQRVKFSYRGWDFVGRQDAIVDGVLVDVKSASPYSMRKFVEGLSDTNDAFGYRAQLEGYLLAHNNSASKVKRCGWIAVDKQNGNVVFAEHQPDPTTFVERLDDVVTTANTFTSIAPRGFDPVPEGVSGNLKLPVECSYCAFKRACHADSNGGAGLKAFSYGKGPVFLTHIARAPKVPELVWDEVDDG